MPLRPAVLILILLGSLLVCRCSQCDGINCVDLHRVTFCDVPVVVDHDLVPDGNMGVAVRVLYVQRNLTICADRELPRWK